MLSLDDVRAFFGLERRKLHPLWIDFFQRVESDGNALAVRKLDGPALLVSLRDGYVTFGADRYTITGKARRAISRHSKARP